MIGHRLATVQHKRGAALNESRIPNPESRGFTLIEVLVVVTILGILAAIVVPKLMDRPDEARVAVLFATVLQRDPAAHSALAVVLSYPGFHARQLHRLAHWCYSKMKCSMLRRPRYDIRWQPEQVIPSSAP